MSKLGNRHPKENNHLLTTPQDLTASFDVIEIYGLLLFERKYQRRHPRSPNFSANEKILLLSIISRYNEIIEGRRDSSGRMKGPIWDRVAKEYNRRTPTGVKRDLTQLRIAYKNMKKLARQRAANGCSDAVPPEEQSVYEMVCDIIGINLKNHTPLLPVEAAS